MRTRRYHFGDRPSRTLLPFLRISPERRMVERENFPSRMSLSLSFFAPNEGSSARQKHRRRRSLSTLSLAFVSIAEKRQRGVCLSSKISARVCSNSRPMGKFNPQKLCALSLSCASLETERRTKNVAREYSRSLDGLAMPARLSRSRIRECKEREKRSKICPEIASFFPSCPLFLQLSAHNFHRGAGESETTTRCEILLFEPNTHREKTTTAKTKKKEENFMSAFYFRSV